MRVVCVRHHQLTGFGGRFFAFQVLAQLARSGGVAHVFVVVFVVAAVACYGVETQRVAVDAECLSARNLVALVHGDGGLRGVQTVAEAVRLDVGGLLVAGKSQSVHAVGHVYAAVGCGTRVDAARYAYAQLAVTEKLLRRDVDVGASRIGWQTGAKGLVHFYRADNVGREHIQCDVLVFRVVRRNRETVQRRNVVTVAQSAYEYVLHSLLFRHTRDFGHGTLRVAHSLAREFLRTHRLYGQHRALLLQQGDIFRFAVGLCRYYHVFQYVLLALQFQVEHYHAPVFDFHLAAHRSLVSYVFNLQVVQAVGDSLQLKIAVEVCHCTDGAAHYLNGGPDERFLGFAVLDGSFYIDGSCPCARRKQADQKRCRNKSFRVTFHLLLYLCFYSCKLRYVLLRRFSIQATIRSHFCFTSVTGCSGNLYIRCTGSGRVFPAHFFSSRIKIFSSCIK